ncbi:MAG: exodeoxyribonuclease VII large subunit, partial [Bryobacterales bacterium]|nr:exodeoxyribonuclease VII large subunit [Bryobacterales bacterium]
IGIITSPAGAVIRDMLNILTRRVPGLHIRLYPALVQGDGAVEQICRGLEYFRTSNWAEVVIVARGGGSVEDLWTFNEEAVARGIVASPVPVISAIGHETDFTIADFVADLRAPTPSAAAELAIGTREQVLERVAGIETRMAQLVRYRMAMAQRRLHQLSVDRAGGTLHRIIGKQQQRVDELSGRAEAVLRTSIGGNNRRLTDLDARLKKLDLRLRLAHAKRRLDAAAARLEESMGRTLGRAHRRLDPLDAHLTQLSPLKILDRGYAIVHREGGEILKSAEQAEAGERLRVRLAAGELSVEVKESKSEA